MSLDTYGAPPPLTPADADLRRFRRMSLDLAALMSSEFWLLASDTGRCAGLELMRHAWHQRPAGSLPDCDRSLAQLSGFGRDEDGWRAVRAEALRDWILCDDGRLYHPMIAEMVHDALSHQASAERRRDDAATRQRASRQRRADAENDVERRRELRRQRDRRYRERKKNQRANEPPAVGADVTRDTPVTSRVTNALERNGTEWSGERVKPLSLHSTDDASSPSRTPKKTDEAKARSAALVEETRARLGRRSVPSWQGLAHINVRKGVEKNDVTTSDRTCVEVCGPDETRGSSAIRSRITNGAVARRARDGRYVVDRSETA